MWKGLLLVGASILPVCAESAPCSLQDLKGRYVAIIAGELSGFWQKCNLRVNGSGRATGLCLTSAGEFVPIDPIQFDVSEDCFVSGEGETGAFSYSLRAERHQRGLSGRFIGDDGVNLFQGPVVAVKRGK